EHMSAVEQMLQKLLDSGLTIHGSKNEFFVLQVLTLGVVLSQEGCSVNPSKVDAILKWDCCQNVSELRSFLGMATGGGCGFNISPLWRNPCSGCTM
ncbi:hypothetical protein BJ741DRAFT_532837, partial [Chytriomyces cf. hyalinus JEL632]